jgi:hypothetical protein
MHSWNQLRSGFAAARPVDSVRLTSGAGYGGSVLTKFIADAGTWYVDGVDTTISTSTFNLTDAHSGKQITFRTAGGFISNIFEMHMPDDLDNLAYWFDASDTANMTLSSGVQQWLARAGTGQFDQATAGSRPTHSATGRNGRPAVSGDGTIRHMIASNMSAWPDENEVETMFALAFCPNTAALEFRCIYGHGSSSTKVRQLLKRDTNGGSTQQDKAGFTSGTAGTDTFVTTPAPTMLGVDTIVMALVKPATIDVIVNGQYTAQKTGLTYDSDGNTGGALFKFPFGGTTGYWPGSAQDIFGYSDELTTLERQKNEGYLAHRWGVSGLLAAGHPYKTLGPRVPH